MCWSRINGKKLQDCLLAELIGRKNYLEQKQSEFYHLYPSIEIELEWVEEELKRRSEIKS